MTKKISGSNLITILILVVFFVLTIILEQMIDHTDRMNMLLVCLRLGAIYSLCAVALNLVNGFTGLFSLGHAGFMLIGAVTYAVFSMPLEARDSVYLYFEYAVKFSFPEVLGNWIGGPGEIIGMLISIILGGIVAAAIAFLIGLPVLRMRGDYLAIATLGFGEIIRAIFMWNGMGPITNAANPL